MRTRTLYLAAVYKKNGDTFAGADLRWANLVGADFSGADFSGANFTGACLVEANFTEANLSGAKLRWADLSGAKLAGTCLDPQAPIPETDLSALETDGEYVYGWRTAHSQCMGSTQYAPRAEPYEAPYFSISEAMDCHPGLYLAPSVEWLSSRQYSTPYVRVKALRSETLQVGGKYRAKRLWVLK